MFIPSNIGDCLWKLLCDICGDFGVLFGLGNFCGDVLGVIENFCGDTNVEIPPTFSGVWSGDTGWSMEADGTLGKCKSEITKYKLYLNDWTFACIFKLVSNPFININDLFEWWE